MRFVAPPHWPQWLTSIPMAAISEGMFAKMWVTLVFHIWDLLIFLVVFFVGDDGMCVVFLGGEKKGKLSWTSKTHDLAVVVL